MHKIILIGLTSFGMSTLALADGYPESEVALQALKNQGLAQGLSKEVIDKLDGDQLTEILNHDDEDSPYVSILVPLFFFLFLGGIVGGGIWSRHRQHTQRQETLRLMVEKGATIPPEFLAPPKPHKKSDLHRGVILLFAGLGITIFFAAHSSLSSGKWAIGMIPLLIGVGYLIVWKLDPQARNP